MDQARQKYTQDSSLSPNHRARPALKDLSRMRSKMIGLALRPILCLLIATSLPPNLHYKLIRTSQRLYPEVVSM